MIDEEWMNHSTNAFGKAFGKAFGLFFLMVFISTFGYSGSAKDNFRLTALEANNWLISYTPDIVQPTTVMIDGKAHLLFNGSSLDAGDATGLPMLPVEAVTFGIPPGASARVEMLDPQYESTENVFVAPFPEYSLDENRDAIPSYRKNPVAYSQSRLFPSTQFVVDGPTMLRDQSIVTLRISPCQYNPATKSLRRLVRASFRVSLLGQNGSAMSVPKASATVSDPFFEQSYKGLIWNYDQARGWRSQREPRFLSTPPDSTRDWFVTGKNYYKIPISKDGWYKVTKPQLVAAGANGNLIDIPSLKMYTRGAEIPLVVRPDSSVEFFALRNYGDSTYLDYYTDTSAYWLTWGGSAGRRFAPVTIDSTSPTPLVKSAVVMRHFEENNWYYVGTTRSELINTQTIPGEGWAWGTPENWFFPYTTNTYPFALDNIDASPNQQATLRVRLVSTTPDFTSPNHKARFWVNDSLAGEITFPGRTQPVFSATIPQSWLRNGNNVLKIQSILTQAAPNQFFLDWFEVTYLRSLVPVQNQLTFGMPSSSVQTKFNFAVDGFASPDISVYDVSTKRVITNGTITATPNGYKVTFRDTISAPRSFVVAGGSSAIPVSSVTQKMFTDIRVNPAGADYIIITHNNFLASAQQLAMHRQTVNGVRVKIIDVEDIYDEFNFGVMNATKLKTFLKYAYDNWAAPRPSNLLLFGDACWDFHRYLATTIKTNYVPAYGVPAGDNWYVCFNPDTSALPFMFVGRIPVQDPVQAQRTVAKLIGYDNYTLSDWNKNFLFITGGNTPSEQSEFNAYSESLINTKILPKPIGGTPFRVYKTTSSVIDGVYKDTLKNYVKNGLLFMNFIGHSGGRIWGVDIGPPTELENTNGKLPFVASVSCNVGAFAEPTGNVLAEDFMMADNRAAIAAWASSSLGFPNYGSDLVNDFLTGVRDSVRALGALTTAARIKMLRVYGNDYIALAMVNLNPLIGDPLTTLALPLKPDLAVTPDDISTDNATPTPTDSLVNLKIKFSNYGLVPADSVGVTLTDIYNGQTTYLLNDKQLSPTRHHDSLAVQWNRMDSVGRHTITVSLDPLNRIPEVTKLNNIASSDQYVYANLLSVVKPLLNGVVQPGQQRLVVTSPAGLDSAGFAYIFELDTVATFDSPAKISSGPIVPGPVTGEWLTPPLGVGQVYFWRARTVNGPLLGKWVESSFLTRTDAPAAPLVRWKENTRKQFRRDILIRTAAVDSGVTIAPNVPINLYVRSYRYPADQSHEYYSVIRVNEQAITGYWWEVGYGFMVIRLNEFSGAFDFRAFDVPNSNPSVGRAQADSMVNFIKQTPSGNYIAFSVIYDGATNVSESLKVALERLGSTHVRQAVPGESWAFIGRKGDNGPAMTALEAFSNDTAVVTLQVPNYYSYGSGSISTSPLPIPSSWDSFHWRYGGLPATNMRIAFLGMRGNGSVDTLRIVPKDSTDFSLAFLNSITSGSRYVSVRTAALLSSTDALVTPVLRDWWMDFIPPADLAISARTLSGASPTTRNIEVTVYNIGYQTSDTCTVAIAVYDRSNRARQLASVALPPIAAGSSRIAMIPLSTSNLPRQTTLQASVIPSKKSKDLTSANNTAYYSFTTRSVEAAGDVQVYANGIRLMDGDYVPTAPEFSLRIQREVKPVQTQIQLFLDGRLVQSSITSRTVKGGDDPKFTTTLPDGDHQLLFKVSSLNSFGDVDSLEQAMNVKVSSENKIMQLFNYPNPFAQETYFTFVLSGSVRPDELVIRIFTVSGRKIREISVAPSSLQIGFNRIQWDGRDSEGDEIANGYYFYQVSSRGEGKFNSAIQKLVKAR